MLMGADVPIRYVKLCILSLVFFTIYFEILTKSLFMRTGTSWNKTHDDEQRQHAINGVPTGIPGSVEVRMLQMGARPGYSWRRKASLLQMGARLKELSAGGQPSNGSLSARRQPSKELSARGHPSRG